MQIQQFDKISQKLTSIKNNFEKHSCLLQQFWQQLISNKQELIQYASIVIKQPIKLFETNLRNQLKLFKKIKYKYKSLNLNKNEQELIVKFIIVSFDKHFQNHFNLTREKSYKKFSSIIKYFNQEVKEQILLETIYNKEKNLLLYSMKNSQIHNQRIKEKWIGYLMKQFFIDVKNWKGQKFSMVYMPLITQKFIFQTIFPLCFKLLNRSQQNLYVLSHFLQHLPKTLDLSQVSFDFFEKHFQKRLFTKQEPTSTILKQLFLRTNSLQTLMNIIKLLDKLNKNRNITIRLYEPLIQVLNKNNEENSNSHKILILQSIFNILKSKLQNPQQILQFAKKYLNLLINKNIIISSQFLLKFTKQFKITKHAIIYVNCLLSLVLLFQKEVPKQWIYQANRYLDQEKWYFNQLVLSYGSLISIYLSHVKDQQLQIKNWMALFLQVEINNSTLKSLKKNNLKQLYNILCLYCFSSYQMIQQEADKVSLLLIYCLKGVNIAEVGIKKQGNLVIRGLSAYFKLIEEKDQCKYQKSILILKQLCKKHQEYGINKLEISLMCQMLSNLCPRTIKLIKNKLKQIKEQSQIIQIIQEYNSIKKLKYNSNYLCYLCEEGNIEILQILFKQYQIFLKQQNYNLKGKTLLVEFEKKINQNQRVKMFKKFEKLMIDLKFKIKPTLKQIYNQQFKILDQQQAFIKTSQIHFQNMIFYFHKLGNLLIKLAKSDSIQVQKFLCSKIQTFMYLKNNLFHWQLYLIVYYILNKRVKIRKYSKIIAYIILQISNQKLPDSYHMKQLLQGMMSINLNFLILENNPYLILILEKVSYYLISNQEIDIKHKLQAVKFYLNISQIGYQDKLQRLYQILIKNINLISNSQYSQQILIKVLNFINTDQYSKLFQNILNYSQKSQQVILTALFNCQKRDKFIPKFQDLIKIQILMETKQEQLYSIVQKIQKCFKVQLTSQKIKDFELVKFIQHHSNYTVQLYASLCKTIMIQNQSIKQIIFKKIFEAANILFDKNFNQQGLSFFPSFIKQNFQFMDQNQLVQCFKIIILKYTSKPQLKHLTQNCLQLGIFLLQKYATKDQYKTKLIQLFQSFLQLKSSSKSIANIIYLAILAPFIKNNQNLLSIEKKIMGLFNGPHQDQQFSVSKQLPQLMPFFKNPQKILQQLLQKFQSLKKQQIGICYLISGLCKAIGLNSIKKFNIIQIICKDFQNIKDQNQLNKKLRLLKCLIEIMENIIRILILAMSCNHQQVRTLATLTTKIVMNKLTGYGVKIILPYLLKNLQEDISQRKKLLYIWALGSMAHCSAKQLQSCLPRIVPVLSHCLSDSNPKIREKTSQALWQIGQTIKNPQISSNVDILIEALSDPFDYSSKGLDILLKTKFMHYIDTSALSLIVPIVDYCLRGRIPEMKKRACQVVGSISMLIQDSRQLIPYLEWLSKGLKSSLTDNLPQLRLIASKAIGKISAKIGPQNTQKYLSFLEEIIESNTSTSIEKQGAAEALSQIMCCHTFEYFETKLYKIFDRLASAKKPSKQGFINIFIYIPIILKQDFQPYIKDVMQNVYQYISDEQQSLRQSSLQVVKILVQKYGLQNTKMLINPLLQGLFSSEWRKRNSALILFSQMLQILKKEQHNFTTNQTNYYYLSVMSVYCLREDEIQNPRSTANQIWNNFIQNTPKTLKNGINQLIKLWVIGIKKSATNVILRSISGFISKYGQSLFNDIIKAFELLAKQDDSKIAGLFDVLKQFLKKLNYNFLMKYKKQIRNLFQIKFNTNNTQIIVALCKCICIFFQNSNDQYIFQKLIIPIIVKSQQLKQNEEMYIRGLNILNSLLKIQSIPINNVLIQYIMKNPLTVFRLQLIINNCDYIADLVFSKRQIFFNEIQSNQLVIYCLKILSVHLNKQNKFKILQFYLVKMNQLCEKIESDKIECIQLLKTYLQLFLYFIKHVISEQIPNLQLLISKLALLAFIQDPTLQQMLNQLFNLLFSNPNSQILAQYFKQFSITLANSFNSKQIKYVPIWNTIESADIYLQNMLNALAYLGIQLFEQSIQMIQLFIDHTPFQILDKFTIKLTGPLIRVSNYRLTAHQKLRIQNLIKKEFNIKLNLIPFTNQIILMQLKFLKENFQNQKIVNQVIFIINSILKINNKRQKIILDLLNRVLQIKQPLLYVIFQILNQLASLFIKPTLQTIYKQVNQLIYNQIFSCKEVFLLANIGGRIGKQLSNKQWKLYVSQVSSPKCYFNTIIQYLMFAYHNNCQVDKNIIEKALKNGNKNQCIYLLKSCRYLLNNDEKISQMNFKELIPKQFSGFEQIQQQLLQL